MLRFLFLAFPLTVLALAGFHFVVEAFDLERPESLPERFVLALWLLEASGLVALFVLVRERTLNRWIAGLASGWVGWIFRGPVLVLSVFGATAISMDGWWNLMIGWFVVYTVCGLAMAAVARPLDGRPERSAREQTAAPPVERPPEQRPPAPAGPAVAPGERELP